LAVLTRIGSVNARDVLLGVLFVLLLGDYGDAAITRIRVLLKTRAFVGKNDHKILSLFIDA